VAGKQPYLNSSAAWLRLTTCLFSVWTNEVGEVGGRLLDAGEAARRSAVDVFGGFVGIGPKTSV
jgi:hypothetical protein